MNERIIKLFMQSVDTNYIPLPIEEHIPLWTEKFAELIVRECCGVLTENVEVALDASGSPVYPEGLIYEHFGVEE